MNTRLVMLLAALLALSEAGCGGSTDGDAPGERATSVRAAVADSGGETVGAGAASTVNTTGGVAAPSPMTPRMPGEGPDPMTVTATEEWNAMLEADRELGASLALAQPNCDAAGEHIERLCDLAERICEIAEETGDPDARDRCADGAARCERGRSRYADDCH